MAKPIRRFRHGRPPKTATYPPRPALDKAREDGQVARSRDLGALRRVAAGRRALVALAPRLTRRGWRRCWRARCASTPARWPRPASWASAWSSWRDAAAGGRCCRWALHGAWRRWRRRCWRAAGTGRWKPLAPKFDKLNPLTGLGRMFSKAAARRHAQGQPARAAARRHRRALPEAASRRVRRRAGAAAAGRAGAGRADAARRAGAAAAAAGRVRARRRAAAAPPACASA